MTAKSCAVALSCTAMPSSDIVKLIVNGDEFQQPVNLEEGIVAYPFHIDTKYYTADVHVCALQANLAGSPEFIDSVQAVVIYFDSRKDSGLQEVDRWETLVEKYNPEIRILLCDNCEQNPSPGISKLEAQEWCIERGYELVELNPEKDEEWEEEQDFIETTGAPRILQALHAHVWPDLNLKGESSAYSRNVQALLLNPVSHSLPSSNGAGEDVLSIGQGGDDGLSQELQSLRLREEALKNGNPYDNHILDDPPDALGSGGTTDDFFKLFQNLAEMKEHVSGMSTDDRKACAEQVVQAFWKVMGGDSDELSDESDDAK